MNKSNVIDLIQQTNWIEVDDTVLTKVALALDLPTVKSSGFYLSERSLANLQGVDDDLVKVVKTAINITSVDFAVIEGLRTMERQSRLFNLGATTVLNSKHLTGHAVDLAPFVDGKIRWDWPLYSHIASAMKKSAAQLGVEIGWGGDWTSFKDGPHFELR